MKKYWKFFTVGFQVAIQYRGTIFFKAIRHTMFALMFIVLWTAILKNNQTVGIFNIKTLVTYYIMVEVVDVFYTASAARLLARDINSGDLNNYLTKPIDYWKYIFSYVAGQQTATASASIIMVILSFVFFPSFVSFNAGWVYFILFVLACLGSFFMHSQIFYIVGLLSFWSSSQGSYLRSGVNQIMWIFGGRWIPVSLFPLALIAVVNILPFKYLFSYPVAIFQGNINLNEIYQTFFLQGVWILVLLLLGKVLWNLGIKKYEAYGK